MMRIAGPRQLTNGRLASVCAPRSSSSQHVDGWTGVFTLPCLRRLYSCHQGLSGCGGDNPQERKEGLWEEARRAIELYQEMRATRPKPDNYVFVAALQACAAAGDLLFGRQVHSQIEEHGFEPVDVVVGNSLVNMYAKCGCLRDARLVLDGLREKDVVTWNAMMAGYAQQDGMGHEALSLYSAMRNEGLVVPDAVTFVCLLQACANMGVPALEKGKQLHSELKERGVQSHIAVGASLVNMYAKCGSLRDARIVFDGLREKDVVTWSAMIAGYAQQEGMGQEALSL